MKETARGSVAVHLSMEAKPREGLTKKDLEGVLLDVGNPILAETSEGFLNVDQIEQAVPGEIVWACDFCGAYSKDLLTVERHEQTCKERT